MSTTIDSLQIEIRSNSTNAASSINDLEKALKKLNKNGDVSNAITSLNGLRNSLHAFVNMPSNASKIDALSNSLKSLSKIKPIDLGSSLGSIKKAMDSLGSINVDNVAPQIERIAGALTPLNNVKGSGFNSMMNGFKKLNEVVDSLDSATIDRFVGKIKELDEKLGPVSKKLVAIGNAFKGVNSKAIEASGGLSVFGGKVNTTTLNLQSIVSVAQSVWAALQPLVRLLTNTIGQALEWDGIEYQFGKAFGEQADEYYQKITEITDALKINKQTFMENSAMAASMLTGFGVNSADAREMGVGYAELAYDIWAAYNNVYKTLDGADGAMAAVRSAISGEVEPIRRAGFTIVDSQLKITAANHGIAYSSEKATEAQKSYLRYLTLIDQAQKKGIIGTYASEMDTAEGMVRAFTQQLKSLAQTFGSIFLPVLVRVMPWLQAFVDLLGDAIMAVANFFGVDIQKVDFSDNGIDGVGESADSATNSVQNTTKALKELKNATVGIDELNVISPNTGGSGSGSIPGGGDGYDLPIKSPWDKSLYDNIQSEVDAIKERLKEALSGITAVVSGFTLAIGTILVVSGANIPLGLGLMAVGAVGLVATIAENWSAMSDELAKTLTVVTSILGGFLLAIGAFLAFSGVNVGLGVALMAAGAVSLATAATINWKFLEGELDSSLSILTGIVSGGLLAMGALFAFTGVGVGLGIALMAAGAIGLVTAVGLNWDSMSEPTRKAIGTLEAIVGGGLLAFGAILALTGVNVPLGIGMIAAGAISLVSAVALNWGSLDGDLKNKVATITTIVSGALLGVGAILAFTGVATALGIGMMAAGAVGIVAAAGINWSGLVEKIKEVLKEIGIAVGAALLALGILLVCTGVALPVGIALIAVGAASLVAGVALNWDFIVTSIKNVLKKVGIIAGAAMLALGILLVCTGVGIPLGIGLIVVGAASLAAGVALNWDYIVNAVKNFFKKMGIIIGAASLTLGILLVCTGVGIPLGIGLIAAGAASLAAGIALNWDTIKEKVKKAINSIKEWVKTYGLLALGVILCLTGGAIPLGIALIKKGLDTKTANGSTVGNELLKTIKEKWKAVKDWWNSKPALKEISASVENMRTKISNKWTDARNWWNSKKPSLATVQASVASVKDKLSSAWTNARNWWNSKPALKNVSVAVTSIKDRLVSAWNTAKNWFNKQSLKMDIKTPHFSVGWNYNISNTMATIADFLFDKRALPKIDIAWYAQGGLPNMGEMFVAREAGPELVGRIGNRNAVANNDQIVEAVSEGVYAAVVAAMRASGGDGGGNQSINVYLDGKQITASVEKRQRERGATIMGSQVYSY